MGTEVTPVWETRGSSVASCVYIYVSGRTAGQCWGVVSAAGGGGFCSRPVQVCVCVPLQQASAGVCVCVCPPLHFCTVVPLSQ